MCPIESSPARWEVFGATARGSLHARVGRQNQDAYGCRADPAGRWAIAALADGHGHELAVRAGTGARLAVDLAMALSADYCRREGPTAGSVGEEMARLLVETWRSAVEQHLDGSPWSKDELERCGRTDLLLEHPVSGYGTTVILTVAREATVLCWQLGDGESLAVTSAGAVVPTLPDDARLVGTRTTSLASRSAEGDFRFSTLDAGATAIAALVSASDGYVNSFTDDDGYAQAARDIWKLIGDKGAPAVADSLQGWLASTSAEGTGDDATMTVLYDAAAALRAEADRPSAESREASR
jgi:hypothetical protein